MKGFCLLKTCLFAFFFVYYGYPDNGIKGMKMENSKEISRWKNFLVNVGFHCMVLGMIGILFLILASFLVVSIGLPTSAFYTIMGAGLIFGVSWSILCMRCNCRNSKPDQD